METLAEWIDWLYMPLGRFTHPGERFFYPCFIISLLLAMWVYRGKFFKKNMKNLWQKELWWNASTKLDYKLFYFTPHIVGILWLPVFITLQIDIVRFIDKAILFLFGPIDTSFWPAWLVTALYSIVLFCALDFSRFLMHYAMHRYEPLWQLHRLHHTATTLNPFTVFRFHPLEILMVKFRNLAVISLVTGIFQSLFPAQLSVWLILGAYTFDFIFNHTGAILRHSPVPLKYPDFMEKFIMSPVQHQMHHSSDEAHYNANYGVVLSFWDTLFGTVKLSPKEDVKLRYGVIEDGKLVEDHRFLFNLYRPIGQIKDFLARIITAAFYLPAKWRRSNE